MMVSLHSSLYGETVMSETRERKVCGAKTGQSTPCQRSPMKGRDRCYLHGGATPRGVNNPKTIHGRKSKDLPERLQPNLERAIHDQELSSLQDEIVIIDVLIADLVQGLSREESGATWLRLRDLLKEYKRANADDKIFVLEDIFETIQTGAAEVERREELTTLIERKGRLVSLEIRHLKDLNVLIPSDKVVLMLMGITDLALRFIKNEDDRRAMAAEARRMLNIREIGKIREVSDGPDAA